MKLNFGTNNEFLRQCIFKELMENKEEYGIKDLRERIFKDKKDEKELENQYCVVDIFMKKNRLNNNNRTDVNAVLHKLDLILDEDNKKVKLYREKQQYKKDNTRIVYINEDYLHESIDAYDAEMGKIVE